MLHDASFHEGDYVRVGIAHFRGRKVRGVCGGLRYLGAQGAQARGLRARITTGRT